MMRLETDSFVAEIESSDGIAEALSGLDVERNQRAILSTGEEKYIQAGAYSNGFVIEKRSGRADTHMHARPTGRSPLPAPPQPRLKWWQRLLGTDTVLGPHEYAFTQAEVVTVFTAHFEGAADPDFLSWHPGYH